MSSSQNSTLTKIALALKSFSNMELLEIVVSSAFLAFMVAFSNILIGQPWIGTFVIGLATIILSMLIHFTVQKYFARIYDCTVTYKMNYNLILIGLLFALLTNGGIIFAATGAITITSAYFTRIGYKYVNITNREKGIISLSGPASNIILALIGLLLYPINTVFFQQLININVFFALFNMIPWPPLDGHAVFWWSRMVWAAGILVPLFMSFFAFNLILALAGAIITIIITFVLWQLLY